MEHFDNPRFTEEQQAKLWRTMSDIAKQMGINVMTPHGLDQAVDAFARIGQEVAPEIFADKSDRHCFYVGTGGLRTVTLDY